MSTAGVDIQSTWEGSFVLMHTGEMNCGQPTLTVQVVPDSGTGGLTGLSGQLSIDIRTGGISMSWRMS
jgi:hypothetical protein